MFALFHHNPSRPYLVQMFSAENMSEAIHRAIQIVLKIALEQQCEKLEKECEMHVLNRGFSANVQFEEDIPEDWLHWPEQTISKFLRTLAPVAGLTNQDFELDEDERKPYIDLQFFEKYLESPTLVQSELEYEPPSRQSLESEQIRSRVQTMMPSRKKTTISFDKSPGVEMPEGFWARGPKVGVEDRILGNLYRGLWSFPETSNATPEDWDKFQKFLISFSGPSFKWAYLPMPSQQHFISLDQTPFRLEFPSYVLSTPETSIGFWSLKDEKLYCSLPESNPLVGNLRLSVPEAEIITKDFEPSSEETDSDLSISEKQKEASHSDALPIHSSEED